MLTERYTGGASLVLGVLLACSLAAPAGAAAEPALGAASACPVIVYHSAPKLRAQRACMNLAVTTHGTKPGTYLFMGPAAIFGSGVGIYQDNGDLVWWQSASATEAEDVNVVRYRGHDYLAVWSGESSFNDPYGMGSVSLYNEHYERVGTITSARPFGPDRIDAHELRITPQGDALFGIYEPVGATFHGRRVEVYQYVVQKVSLIRGPHGIHTGRLLFQWDSIKHVPLSQSYLPARADHAVWDYFHGNSIAQDSDGNVLVSSRNTWGVYKINVTTGRTMWQLGTKGGPRLPTPWCYQHDIVALGSGRYSLFDDGEGGPGCEDGANAHPARGLVFRVDATHKAARLSLLRAYWHHPDVYSGCCGSMQALPDGGALIDWGNDAQVSEFDPGGGLRMDLSLSNWSYRATRFAWVGRPLTRPAVAGHLTAAGTDVWASWNGSTQVAAWRVLAGVDPLHLSPVEPPRPKSGFETEVALTHPYAYVAVQALGAGGQVLSTSRAVAAAPSST